MFVYERKMQHEEQFAKTVFWRIVSMKLLGDSLYVNRV